MNGPVESTIPKLDLLTLMPERLKAAHLFVPFASIRSRLPSRFVWRCWIALFVSIQANGEIQLEEISNTPVSAAVTSPTAASVAETNGVQGQTNSFAKLGADVSEPLREKIESARHYRHIRQPREAEAVLVGLLREAAPEGVKQQALFELAGAVKDSGDLPRSEQIYAQYLNRWPNDLRIPEVLLNQGRVFREMGLNNLALAKFYAVMTSSLVLKNDRLDFYQKVVVAAQTEIAETHFQQGKYAEAADFYSRLLKQSSPTLDRLNAQYRLIRSLSALGRHEETVAQGTDFLTRHPDTAEQPEVRFLISLALKNLGRNGESLQQVLSLLQEQKERTKKHPELWAYWQQQAGNEVGNQLYRDADYVRALSVYQALAQLNSQPAWQLPVTYQIGLTYERLVQPQRAIESYQFITRRESEMGTNMPASFRPLLEMARWRAEFIQWQTKAQIAANNAAPIPETGPAAVPQLRAPSAAP
jgi:tetratricopeptide (TPR) repeat protein